MILGLFSIAQQKKPKRCRHLDYYYNYNGVPYRSYFSRDSYFTNFKVIDTIREK